MAAIDFPNSPTNGQIFTSGGMSWTYVTGVGWTLNSAIVDAGSGFTFIQDTMPLPINVGDTWFDNSTGASGGTSWVAIEEGPEGSEKNWVQFAPGTGALTPNSISNSHLAKMPANTFKGNNTAGVADPADLNIAQMQASLGIGSEIDGMVYNGSNGAYYALDLNRKMILETGSAVYQMGNSGWGSFLFQRTYAVPPLVIGMCGDNAQGLVFYSSRSLSTNGWAFVAIRYDMTYPPAGSYHRCNYIAIGPSI